MIETMSSLWDKVLIECGDERGRTAKNLARRLGVKRPAMFSVLFSLQAAALVASSSCSATHAAQKSRAKPRLLWRLATDSEDAEDAGGPEDAEDAEDVDDAEDLGVVVSRQA